MDLQVVFVLIWKSVFYLFIYPIIILFTTPHSPSRTTPGEGREGDYVADCPDDVPMTVQHN